MLTMVLEIYLIESLFFYVRQRQCQYGIENATKNVPATTHQPTGISRLQSSRVQSHVSRSARPSGIPVKTAPNNSLRQAKVNQPTQHEGVGEGTSKSLNNMVVSDAMSLNSMVVGDATSLNSMVVGDAMSLNSMVVTPRP